ncbi:hypothetical protein BVG81_003180 [Haliangium sp. UPWRP_2]|nr:hypothetical protein BVG81_003180 [Haliangium sp. UPWRP_2]
MENESVYLRSNHIKEALGRIKHLSGQISLNRTLERVITKRWLRSQGGMSEVLSSTGQIAIMFPRRQCQSKSEFCLRIWLQPQRVR